MSNVKHLIVLTNTGKHGPGRIGYKVVEPAVFAGLSAPVRFVHCTQYDEPFPDKVAAAVRKVTPELAIPPRVTATVSTPRTTGPLQPLAPLSRMAPG